MHHKNHYGTLKLAFSEAADFNRIDRLFDPQVKSVYDPESHVARRVRPDFTRAVQDGCAAFLHDEDGNIRSLTIAYRLHAETPGTGQHDYTEFGSSLSLMPGYKSTTPVIAALALREWLKHPPIHYIAAEIKQDNIASVRIYGHALGWTPLPANDNAYHMMTTASWRTVVDPAAADPTSHTGYAVPPPEQDQMEWYGCHGNTLRQQAGVLLDAMRRGGLQNRTGNIIPVDFSALEQEGLTEARLAAIESGIACKSALAGIGRP